MPVLRTAPALLLRTPNLPGCATIRSLSGSRACQRSRAYRHLHFSMRTYTSSRAGICSQPSKTTMADQSSSVCWASDWSVASMDVRRLEGMM